MITCIGGGGELRKLGASGECYMLCKADAITGESVLLYGTEVWGCHCR